MRSHLADIVLLVHLAIAMFIVGGLVAVCTYAWHSWRWTRGFRFRLLHALAIGIVAVESMLGLQCPLTVWEDALRGLHSDAGFIQRWAGHLLFYDLPPTVFMMAYIGAALLTAIAWIKVPPQRRAKPPPRATGA